jgi:hypothetical protein
MAAWHPRAIRIVYPSMGPYTGGGRKLLWHTTEGYSLPRYSGSNPHFTLNPATGQLWQHQPITEPSRALVHSPGTPETNRANVVQVELIGFAAQTHDWPDAYYGNISALARWIEANHGVPSKSTVAFTSTATPAGPAPDRHGVRRLLWPPAGTSTPRRTTSTGTRAAFASAMSWPTRSPPRCPIPTPTAASSCRGARRARRSSSCRAGSTGSLPGTPATTASWRSTATFGALTKANVVAFQRRHNLVADGRVGPITWNALRKAAV